LIQGAHVETTPNEGKVAKEGGRTEGNKVLAAVVLHYVPGDLGCMKPESNLGIIISCPEQRFILLKPVVYRLRETRARSKQKRHVYL
jgi:hypothetical protein